MTTTYAERMRQAAERAGNILCLGVDPVIGSVPGFDTIDALVDGFYCPLVERLVTNGPVPAAVKPNSAYFEAHGLAGHAALDGFMAFLREAGLPAILDAKRGDIDRSSAAYARAAFDALGADALTVSPYMGSDSVLPFVEAGGAARCTYVLCRTSNAGAADVQALRVGDTDVSEIVADRIVAWSSHGCVGAVVGATDAPALARLAERLGPDVPLLVPGVGTQGGGAAETLAALGRRATLHRVNVGSAIALAHRKGGGDPLEAAVDAARRYADALSP